MKSNNLTSFSNDYYFKKSNNLILTKFKLHLNKIFFISNETSINLINYNSNVYITLTSELKNIMFLHAMVGNLLFGYTISIIKHSSHIHIV